MRFVLFAHGGSGNHGCEALVRSTCKIIKNRYPMSEIVVATCSIKEDKLYGIEGVEFVEYGRFDIFNPMKYIDKIMRTILKTGVARKGITQPVISNIREGDVCLSIGGDNYSYRNVIPYDIIAVHKAAKRKGCRTILWGCSINEEKLKGQILDDLKEYDCIVARESFTYNSLITAGLTRDKVKLCADPAFLLDIDYSMSEKYTIDTVGINLSPVVMEDESQNGIVIENYEKLMEYILNNTSYNIILVPHVIWSHSNDMEALLRMYNKYSHTGRVKLVEDQSATMLKTIIGKCKTFVGARTHSTIAAYSQCVPTLVLGYSVKARGIAYDLFGTEENYVISTQNLKSQSDLTDAFIWLDNNAVSIRKRLESVIPEYVVRAESAGEYLIGNN